jgi:hypothetical protein
MISRIQHARRRLLRQKGQEAITFALMMLFVYTPLFLWMFVIGMNMIVNIQVNNLARDMDNMFIHGTDFSTYGAQELAQQLATGLGLVIPAFGKTAGVTNTNQATNDGSTGNGMIWINQIMWVGSTSDTLCTAVGASNCVNANSFVYVQQIVFGNSTLTSQKDSSIGYYTGTGISSAGVITSPMTDSFAKLTSTAQTAMQNQWNQSDTCTSNPTGNCALIDGQVVYVVEAFFQTPTLSLGPIYTVPGTYARYFF